MKPIRHLFWDFDGTLYDSYPNVTHAFLCTLDELGYPELVTPREALSLLKVSVFSAVQHCAGMAGLDVSQALEVFSRYHAQESSFAPYTGLSECLRALRAAGVHHYLYTHRDRRAVEQLEQDGLWSLFSDGVTSEDGFPHTSPRRTRFAACWPATPLTRPLPPWWATAISTLKRGITRACAACCSTPTASIQCASGAVCQKHGGTHPPADFLKATDLPGIAMQVRFGYAKAAWLKPCRFPFPRRQNHSAASLRNCGFGPFS